MMVVRRPSTSYRLLQNETAEGATYSEIELRQQRVNHSETSARKLSGIAIIRDVSHDNDFLLPTRSREDQPKRPVRQRFFSGWRVGALASLVGVVSVLLFNFIITIWVWTRPAHDLEKENGVLFRGRCSDVRRLNVWVHVLVNAISTLLLCASNYCMQVLSAPSRPELDRAHARRYWLHIGVPNIRNLKHIAPRRRIMWYLLGLSSAPLHLLFNSVVFSNFQANNYAVIPTTESWLHGGPYDNSSFSGVSYQNAKAIVSEMNSYRINLTETLEPSNNTPKYANISAAACIDIYIDHYVSDFGQVYLIQDLPTVWRDPSAWSLYRNNSNGYFVWVTKGSDSPGNTYYPQSTEDTIPFRSSPSNGQSSATGYLDVSNAWMCPSHAEDSCDIGNEFEVPKDRSKWAPYDRPVRYCLVERVPDKYCKLLFSLPIATTVIMANLIKAICIAVTLFAFRDHAALVTIGDVIASYLDHSDQETGGRCLYSRQTIETEWDTKDVNGDRKRHTHVQPVRYKPKARRWAMAASQERWIWTYATYFVAFTAAIPSLYYSLQGIPFDAAGLWKLGFGTVTSKNLLNITLPLMGGVLFANIPQALLSYLYLAYNALYTNMFVAHEWSTYLNERKPLRVTSPLSVQRGTYWLNVPFRYAIPMTIISGVFHWLASQSIFMVQITILSEKRTPVKQISTCGYSPMAIILTLVVATVIAGSGLVISYRRYPAGIPLASSCSAAISAACHALPEDVDASCSIVQWGAVTHGTDEGGKEPVGHCSFSSFSVEPPIPGRLYA